MAERTIPLERLRGLPVNGRFLYTDAVEPPREQIEFDPRGLYQVLLNVGFRYHNEGTGPVTTWMRAPQGETNIRYHDSAGSHEIFGGDSRIKTRIDFFSKDQASDAMHTAAGEILKAGRLVFVVGEFVSSEYGQGLVKIEG